MYFDNQAAQKAWHDLCTHIEQEIRPFTLEALNADHLKREVDLIFRVGGVSVNFTYEHLVPKTLDLFSKLGEAQRVVQSLDAMMRGDLVNVTEKRAVLHTALRSIQDEIFVDSCNVMPEIRTTKEKVKKFVEDVREGRWRGATGKKIKTVVNIGIGGSDLGPRFVTDALDDYVTELSVRYVANIDARDLRKNLKDLDPETTLFLVVSKTFTTPETLENAMSARAWLKVQLGDASVDRHFVAISSNLKAVEEFGIARDNVFPMWDWVGGRYSVWSAVGLSIALATGWDVFAAFLDGARRMDDHVRMSSLEENIPFLIAMTGIVNRNIWNYPALAVLPYDDRLMLLPSDLQQVWMESNGKSVTRAGKKVEGVPCSIIFGGTGTICQHSFMQFLHQGPVVPAHFIGVEKDDRSPAHHHRALRDNLRAQRRALAFGRCVEFNVAASNPGNRPSTEITLDSVTPENIGCLVSMYEHVVAYEGFIFDINSFDQYGVEAGKIMAREEAANCPVVRPCEKELAAYFLSKKRESDV